MGLIDAYKAMKSIDEIVCSMSVCINSDYCHGMMAMKDAAIHAIEEQPTVDAVPVVRCRECKYMRESVDGLFKSGYFCERCHITSDMENCDDFYCADGERRSR